ncbi:MAG: hypothetical protein N2319_11140 [Candidatus Kapabacteria bacterium]|nr:hypothetical protein [Candidatus Kapabacteria bacterium]
MKKLGVYLLTFTFLFINVINVTTQESDSGLINALKTNKGILLIYNKDKNNFKFEIECKDAFPFDPESMAFLIDKRFFQLVIVPINEVIRKPIANMTDIEILTAHKNFEMDYIYEVSGMNFTTKIDTIINNQNRKFLYWELNIPLTPQDTASDIIKTKLYMNTLLDDEILSLSMAVTVNDNSDEARKLLKSISQNFEHTITSYNVEQIADSLKAIK